MDINENLILECLNGLNNRARHKQKHKDYFKCRTANRVAMREAIMEKVIKQRLKNLFIYLQKKEGKSYDYRDIAVKFERNLPTDLTGF